jgi:hypothetical protein
MTFFEIELFVVFPAFIVAALVLGEAIRQRVRKHHPDLYDQLGRPAPLAFEKLNGFLASRGYRGLADERLARMAETMIWLRRVFLVAASAWFVSITYRRPLALVAVALAALGASALIAYMRHRRKRAV